MTIVNPSYFDQGNEDTELCVNENGFIKNGL